MKIVHRYLNLEDFDILFLQNNVPLSILSRHSSRNDIEAPQEKYNNDEDDTIDNIHNDETDNTDNPNAANYSLEHNFSLKQSCILYVLFLFGFASGIGNIFSSQRSSSNANFMIATWFK